MAGPGPGPGPTPRREAFALAGAPAGSGRGRRRRRVGRGALAIAGTEVVVEHPEVLAAPLRFPAGLIARAAIDAGEGPGGALARFGLQEGAPPRPGAAAPLPRHWLWTERDDATVPRLGEGAPNLALVLVAPLDPAAVVAAFRPEVLRALARRSPLGELSLTGLVAALVDPIAAERAFAELGVLGPLTSRQVAPAQCRSAPLELEAAAAAATVRVPAAAAARGSVAPPGAA